MMKADPTAVADKVDVLAADVASRRGDLLNRAVFPADLWKAFAEQGLLGLTLPKDLGGLGGDYATLAAAAARLTERSGVLGVTISWLCHIMNARLHLDRKGTPDQRAHWLPRLAAGNSTICIAISEPGVGAHPKHLATRAESDGDAYVVTGEKTYLTNGPLADLFLVLAITGEQDGRKLFSAILVPRDTPGLEQTPGVAIDFLHPSPHCGLKLTDCRVPAANLLGAPDGGLHEISLPMRAIEDALNTSSLAGALAAELRYVGDGLRGDVAREVLSSFGGLMARADGLQAIAANLADQLDRDDRTPERLNAASAGFRAFARTLQDDIEAFVDAHGVVLSDDARMLARDLSGTFGIAGQVHAMQAAKRAEAYISEGKTT